MKQKTFNKILKIIEKYNYENKIISKRKEWINKK